MNTIKPSVILIVWLLFCSIGMYSCSEYLDLKPDKRFATLETLDILQGTLDYYTNINNRDVASGEISADNYYLDSNAYNALTEEGRRMYVWEKDYFFPNAFNDWSFIYQRVYAANSVLANVQKIDRTADNASLWDDVAGQALFIRGRAFLEAVGVWGVAYDEESISDLGIPLRLDADINVKSTRASVVESYEQVLADLHEASELLPLTAVHVMRPSKPAAWALLARTYLYMRKYDLALEYADSCLAIRNQLINYNDLDGTSAYPIPLFNDEVIYHSVMGNPNHVSPNRAKIDTSLLNLYGSNDLRKEIFFEDNSDGSQAFKGSYASPSLFSGVSSSEIYLTLSECYARLGKKDQARSMLERLLEKRYVSGTVLPTATVVKAEGNGLLKLILDERRKELLMRGIRWMDIKRLNKEGAGIVITRRINETTYELTPNHIRYALPLPEDVVKESGMPQTPR